MSSSAAIPSALPEDQASRKATQSPAAPSTPASAAEPQPAAAKKSSTTSSNEHSQQSDQPLEKQESVAEWSMRDQGDVPTPPASPQKVEGTSSEKKEGDESSDSRAEAATGSASPRDPLMETSVPRTTEDKNDGEKGGNDDGEGKKDEKEENNSDDEEENAEQPKRKDVKLSAADQSSIMTRSATFIPFNPWSQDIGQLSVVEKHLDEPVVLTPLQQTQQNKLVRFQSDNNASLKHHDVLGFNFDNNLRGSNTRVVLAHAEDENVVYGVGRHISVAGVSSTFRQMLTRAEQCIAVNTFDVSSNGKYIAVSERRVDAPYVSVYKLDSAAKVASLNFKFLSKTQVTSVAFSSNNKYLVTITGEPDQKVFMWQLDDVKVIAMMDMTPAGIKAAHVTVNPWSSMFFATRSPSSFLLWKIADKQLQHFDPIPMSKRPVFTRTKPNWVAHTWYDEECVAGVCEDGTLVAVEDNEVKQVLQVTSQEMPKVTSIVWASRGVIIAGANGVMLLLDRTYGSDIFAPVAMFHTTERGESIRAISVSPAELNIVVALSNNTMEWMSLAVLDDTLQQMAEEEAEEMERNMSEEEKVAMMERNSQVAAHGNFSAEASKILRSNQSFLGSDAVKSPTGAMNASLLASPKNLMSPTNNLNIADMAVRVTRDLFNPMTHVSFHMDTVTSISFAYQRPLVLTTGSDCNVRVFDYVNHRTIICKKMEDELLSGSIHPMGLHMVLAFRFSVKVYSILEDDVVQMCELNIKSAHETRYNPQGSRIAFAIANRVVVHDGHSYAFLGMLVGHTSMIKSISWMPHGNICTADVVGMLICWNGTTFKRSGVDSSHKSLILQHGMFDSESKLFAAVGSNKHARGKIFEGEFTIICASAGQTEDTLVYVRPGMVLPKSLASRKLHCNLIALAQLSKTLFVGTPTGRVLLFSWPLLATSKPYDYIDSHNSEIVHLHLSPNEKYLFTIGSDHVMYIYDVTQVKAGKFVTIDAFNYSLFDGVKYMLASDMDDRDREIYNLKRRLEDRVAECDAHLSLLQGKKEKEKKDYTTKSENQIDKLRAQIDKIADEVSAVEKKMAAHTESVESDHIHTAEEIENLYNKRSEDALKQFRILEGEKEELIVRYETVVGNKVSAGEQMRAKLEANRREVEKQLSKEVEEWREKIRANAMKYDAMIAQTVVDMETEMHHSNVKHEAAMKTNEDKVIKATTSASVGDREAERQKRELVLTQHRLDNRSGIHKDLVAVSERKAREIKQLKTEMLSKQEAINVAERNMQQLKQQLTVLENLRFVLTYQFDELQAEVVPKDGKIRQLEHRVVEMEAELQHINVERNATKERVQAVDAQLTELTAVQRSQKVKQLDMERKYKTFIDELGRLQERYKDSKRFAVDFAKVIKDAKATFSYKEPEMDVEAMKLAEELKTHEEYLKAKNAHQTTYVSKKEKIMEDRSRDLMYENTNFVQEIKVLRQERKRLQNHCNNAEMQLRDVRMQLHRLANVPRAITAGPATPAITASPLTVARTPSPATEANTSTKSGPSTQARPLLPPISGTPVADTPAPSPSFDTVKKPGKFVSKKKGSIAAAKKKPSTVPKPKTAPDGSVSKKSLHQTQLQEAIQQLDSNTEIMREQEDEINTLRSFVQDLLKSEEERLMKNLRAAGGGGSGMHSTSPVDFQGVTPGPDESSIDRSDLSPDWAVDTTIGAKAVPIPDPAVDGADAARPMTPGSKPPPAPEM